MLFARLPCGYTKPTDTSSTRKKINQPMNMTIGPNSESQVLSDSHHRMRFRHCIRQWTSYETVDDRSCSEYRKFGLILLVNHGMVLTLPETIFSYICIGWSAKKGGYPAAISYISTPRAHQSTALLYPYKTNSTWKKNYKNQWLITIFAMTTVHISKALAS